MSSSIEATSQFFRVDFQHRLTEWEVHRRKLIKQKLEEQFALWQNEEQHRWLAIPHSLTVSFLGLEWSSIRVYFKDYFSRSAIFGLLSELQLSVIPAPRSLNYPREKTPPESWLYKQYSQYEIRIQDFGENPKKYRIPLIEIAVAPEELLENQPLFMTSSPEDVSHMLPDRTAAFRLVIFPQTRYSFIEDEIFHALYPLPEEQVKLMSHTLLQRFQMNSGYYNVLPDPFVDSFTQRSPGGSDFRYFAAMYPVIDFEFVQDYEKRKTSEKFVTSLQQRPLKDIRDIPSISQWRYSRKFDFVEESKLQTEPSQGDSRPERIQSARALFEFACGENNAMELDRRQISIEQNEHKPRLLVVDPLWLIIFPESDTICVFRNETMVDHFRGVWGESIESQNWGQVLIQLVNKADTCMGSYEPIYRKKLSNLQYQIHSHHNDRLVVKAQINDLSLFVTELAILLEPLQAQIKSLKHWRICQSESWQAMSQSTDNAFEDAIKMREAHLKSLTQLLERARELQAVLFQLSNIETANLQAEIALQMQKETKVQVQIAKRTESQNRTILIFTVVTVIFLPLSFFTSYFGMNTVDIRDMSGGQGYFWAIAGPLSLTTIVVSSYFAFRHGANNRVSQVCD